MEKTVYSTDKNLNKEIQVESHISIKTEIEDLKEDNKPKPNKGYYSYVC